MAMPREGRKAGEGGGRATHVPTDGAAVVRKGREGGQFANCKRIDFLYVGRPSNLADPFRDRKDSC